MFANGIGVKQSETRSELYSAANDARSAEVVPGMPLGSDAPGAPGVEPPIAEGQTGATGGGVGAGSLTTAGVVVYIGPVTVAAAAAVVVDWADGADALALGAAAAEDACVAADTAAVTDFAPDTADNPVASLLAATELATVTPPLACDTDGTDEPVP
jgi:hypothetical protein